MTLRAAALLIFIASTARAQLPNTSAARLAQRWSGSANPPTCHLRGPRGEYLEPRMGQRYCDWPAGANGRVGLMVYRMKPQPVLILWKLDPSAPGFDRLVDSLSRALQQAGLRRSECAAIDVPAGRRTGFRFDSDTLGVEYSLITPPRGARSAWVVASDNPAGMFRWLCDGTPPPGLPAR